MANIPFLNNTSFSAAITVANSATASNFITTTDSGININGITLTRVAANSAIRVSQGLETLGLLRSYSNLIVATTGTFGGDVSVEDNLYLTDSGTVRGKIQLNSSDRDDLDIKAVSLSSNMKFFTVDTERMRINSSGNVGIGTTSPSEKLEVIGGTKITQSGAALYVNSSNANGSYVTWENDGTDIGYIGAGYHLWSSPNNIATSLGIRANARLDLGVQASVHMTILNSGNVGIGTTSPSYPLDVVGDGIRLTRNSKTFIFNADFASAGTHANIQSDAGMGLSFSTNASEKMRITSAGNVGIGTTSPTTKLNVSGNIAVSSGSYLSFIDSNLSYNKIGRNTSVGGIQITTGASATMNLLDNGNVGIGTTSPLSALDVEGNIELSGVIKGRGSDWTYYSIPNGDGSYPHLFYTRTNSGASLLRAKIGGGLLVGSTEFTNNNFSINSTQLYVRESDGNVGIGTTSPQRNLTIYQSSGNAVLQLANNTSGVGASDGFLAYTDGVNVGLENKENGYLSLATNASEKMRITSAGNVGIGTTSPAAKLHVDDSVGGKLRLSNISATADGEKIGGIETGVANGTFFAGVNFFRHDANDGEIRFRTKVNNTNTDVMTIVDGNVGIGTTSPSASLDILNGTTGASLKLSATTTAYWQLQRNPTTGNLNISDDALGNVMSFDQSTGNVGIGTTSPSVKLSVVGTGTQLGTSGYYHNTLLKDTTNSGVLLGGNNTNNGVGFLAGINELAFLTFGTSWGERMRIDSAGNVGIGTTSPNRSLHVIGQVAIDNSTSPSGGLLVIPDGTSNKVYSRTGNANNLPHPLDFISGSSTSMHIAANGNVGIGTTAPSQKLHISGNMRLTGAFRDRLNSQGAANYVLTSTGSNGTQWVDASGSSIIGGPYLPLDGGTMTGTNGVVFPDAFKLNLGTGSDLQIYHDGSNSYIQDSGSGGLRIASDLFRVYKADLSGLMINAVPDDRVELYFNDNKKLETTSTGVSVTGGWVTSGVSVAQASVEHIDNAKATFGNGNDLQIYHDGSNSYIKDVGTGFLNISSDAALVLSNGTGEPYFIGTSNGSVKLYYDNNKKLETGIVSVGTATIAGGTLIDGWKTTTQANAINDTTIATTAYVNNKIALIPAGLVFQGTWNAATNSPTLTSGSGTTGNFYIVSVAGSTNLDGITDWKVGDWAVFIEQGASDQWEKIDNSSVLDGIGTGGSVAGWAGSGTSNTLTNSPITFSGNNVSFAGNGTFAGSVIAPNVFTQNIYITSSGTNSTNRIDNDGTQLYLTYGGTSSRALEILNSNGNATFAGDVAIQKTGDVYLTLESTDATTTEEVAVKYSNQSTGSNYWWSGLNQSANYSLAYGTSYSGANVKMEISTAGNATFAGQVTGTRLVANGTGNAIELNQSTTGSATYYVMDNTVETGGKRYRFGYSGGSSDKGSFSIYNQTDSVMPLLLSGANATFAGDVTIGSSGAPSDKTLNILTGGSKSAVKLMEAGTVYGFSTVYDGATNKFHINRHNNSAAGTPVLSLNRDDDNATLTGNLYFSGSHLISSNTADGSDNAQIIISGGGADGDTRGATVHLAGNENGNGGLLQLRAGAGAISQIRSYTSGSERMRIDSSGNVGIGTTSPLAKLNIESPLGGDIAFRLTQTSKNWWEFKNTGGTNDLNLSDAFGTYATFKNGGNVGIGTTSPSLKLEVAGNIGLKSDSAYLRFRNAAAADLGYITNSTTWGDSGNDFSIGASSSNLRFYTNNSSTERMRIDSAGAIKFNAYGAGTLVSDASGNITAVTSGAGTGTVTSITKGAGLVVAGSPITTTGSVAVEYAANVQNIITGGSNFIGDTVVSTDQILITDPGSTSTNRRVGRVEIGDLPFLSLAGGTMTGAIIIPEYITHAGDTDTKFGFTAANQFQVIAGGNTNLNVQGNGVDLSYAGSTRLTTQTGGIAITGDLTVTADVGIGTTSPQVPLDVTTSDTGSSFNDGAVQISNTTSASSGGATVMNIRNNYGGGFGTLIKFFRTSVLSSIANISFNSGGTAVNYNTGSDYRLKEDLQTFNGLDILNNISVYNYKWKGVDFRGYGVIAHELQPIFPDAVTGEKDAEEMQSVDYSKLVPVLIKSVQELKKEIELLKQQLNK